MEPFGRSVLGLAFGLRRYYGNVEVALENALIMSHPEESVRERLLKQKAEITRQIEIPQAGPLVNARGGGPDFESVIAELTAALESIEKDLDELGCS